MFGALTSTLGKMFGTEKALTSIVDSVSNGLDKLVYTSEEKADDSTIERAAARQMIVKWMDTTKGQNIARRTIALSIVFTWLFQYLSCMFLNVSAIWFDDPDKIMTSAIVIGEYAEKMNGAVMLVLAFYFASPYMGAMVDGAMTKFSGGKK